MSKPSRAKTGCLVVVSVALLLVFIFLVQWLKPIDVVVPPRQYPPNNAYVQLKALGEQFGETTKRDARLKRGIDLIVDQLKFEAPSLNRQQRADIEYALNRYEPFRRKIVAGLERPSVAVFDYSYEWLFPEMAQFRNFARMNAYLMKQAAQRNNFDRVLTFYEENLTFAQQIDNEGVLVQHLVTIGLEAIVHFQLVQSLPKLNAAQCGRLHKFLKSHLKSSDPITEAMTHEKWLNIQFLKDFQQGKVSSEASDAVFEGGMPPFMRYTNLAWAAREIEEKYQQIEEELVKPSNLQKFPKEPLHIMNQLLFVEFAKLGFLTAYRGSHLRLTACAAAVRAYKMKTGRYPKTLKEAGVQDLNVDPYTGGEFVYKVDPVKGFLLYSVGADGVDDGGTLAKSREGKGDVSYSGAPRRKDKSVIDSPMWLK